MKRTAAELEGGSPGRPLRACLAAQSENSVWRGQCLQNGRAGCSTKPTAPSGAFKRKMARAIAPFSRCYKTLSMPSVQGPDIQFAFAKVKEVLRTLMPRDPALARLVRDSAARQEPLKGILCQDEATAGNVLATEARQKVTFLYLSFQQYGPALTSSKAWLPLSTVARWQVDHAKGGVPALTVTWLEEWARQQLQDPFDVQGCMLSISLSTFCCDFDAMRLSFDAKGSSGLRPCFLCSNCISKSSKAGESDPAFRTIAEPSMRNFLPLQQSEMETFMDGYLAKLPRMTRASQELTEKCCGFHISPLNLWSRAETRSLLQLQTCCNDAMHCYFANGIGSQELLLYWTAVQNRLGVTLQQLQDAISQAGWKRPTQHRRHGQTAYWLKRLFRPKLWEGVMYKGSATETLVLLSLLRWFARQLWSNYPDLRPQYKSFMLLCRCVDCLASLPHSHRFAELARCQEAHHEHFVAAYGDAVRPKHHHRLHLPWHYQRHGVVACWGPESKHKDYKSFLAQTTQHFLTEAEGGKWHSMRLLPKLLRKHVSHNESRPLLLRGASSLLKSVSPAIMSDQLGLRCREAGTECEVGLLHLAAGDVLLWGVERQHAGVCKYFVKLADDEGLWLAAESLELIHRDESQRIFKPAQPSTVLLHRFDTLHLPASPQLWTMQKSDVICML